MGYNNDRIGILFTFLDQAAGDPRVGIGHLGLYVSLFHKWVERGASGALIIASSEAMPLAHISSRITYLRLLQGLSDYGYVRYSASFYKLQGSNIWFD